MRKSTILFLLINFLTAFLFSSCGVNPVQKLTKMPVEKPTFRSVYFANPETDYVYKTNISVYGNELTGIFIAKKIAAESHRVVFTTEFGNKLLDIEISETDYKVNSIVEELDRKFLIQTLVNDFRLLLRGTFQIQNQFEQNGIAVLESKDRDRYNYLYVSKSDAKLSRIVQSTKRKEKISMTFITENNIFAQSIVIQHYDIKLKIALNYFKNQN